MKKFKLFLAAAMIFTAGSAMAQKYGYIKVDNIVALMPETSKLDSLIRIYQVDSLQPRFNYTLSEYQRKDSVVNGKDSARTPATVRAKMRQEMQQDLSELQNWQQIVNQATEQKQNQLLEPIYRKAMAAIQEVAKENGYTYVFTQDALLVAPPTDDILPLVVKKMNLKLPPALAAQLGKTGAGNGANSNGTRPVEKTKTKTKG